MKRAFYPGDAVIAQHPFSGVTVRGIIDTDGAFYTTDPHCRGISSSEFAHSNLRPLVVIDPEDREQVERLEEQVREANGWNLLHQVRRTNALQAALREFANPTPIKPPEPMGLGAVVVEGDGTVFTRVRRDDVHPWIDEEVRCNTWSEIDAVKVLSEGVTP